MRRALLVMVLCVSGCASVPTTPAPKVTATRTRFLIPSSAKDTDIVCLDAHGAEPAACQTVRNVRTFLQSMNAAP